jgi:hypothetical protein
MKYTECKHGNKGANCLECITEFEIELKNVFKKGEQVNKVKRQAVVESQYRANKRRW